MCGPQRKGQLVSIAVWRYVTDGHMKKGAFRELRLLAAIEEDSQMNQNQDSMMSILPGLFSFYHQPFLCSI